MEKLKELVQYLIILGVKPITERQLDSDLDDLADSVNEVFWNNIHNGESYEYAYENANEVLGDELIKLPYIKNRIEESEDWDKGVEYDSFRTLLIEEVFDRANVPQD